LHLAGSLLNLKPIFMTTPNAPLPTNSHVISLDRAKAMTATYRTNRETILLPENQGQDILPLSETFDRQAFDQLLGTPGCAGIRIYYGMDEQLKVHAVMVAVNASNEDLLPASAAQAADEPTDDPVIIDEGQRCPPICPEKKSALNS
jgi:hypothetical protein